NATKFVFGCYKQSLPGGTPDAWMKNYDGGLDEFRIYSKALADADVKALYDLEKAGK
ncbi:MAG: LamG domain-containing protein, partial [Bacteroidetes bacterium]|nr:LamG domain-containing protein [Bacteroidota bacterium]